MASSPNEMAIFERVAARGSFAAQPSVTATEQVSTKAVSIVRSNYRCVAVGIARGFTRSPVR